MSNPFNRLTLVLLAACVGLGTLIERELRAAAAAAPGQPPPVEAPPPAQSEGSVPLEPPPVAALQSYQEILDRPLFVSGRQPPPEPQQAVARQTVRPLRYALEGIAISRHARVAVLRDMTGRQIVSVAQGDELEGWEVKEVRPDRVVLTSGEQTQELALPEADPSADPAAPQRP